MKRIFQICVVLAAAFVTVGCYNDFDTPAPQKVYTDADFDNMKYLTIAEAKSIFTNEYTLENNGDTGSWAQTKYVQVTPEVIAKNFGQGVSEVYIKGKVISNDEEGNVYKTLYLSDETGGIEIKLGTGLYLKYPAGTYDPESKTMPTHYVYVKLNDLYIGNYRMMLSIGDGPTDSYNKLNEHKFYANSNIENSATVASHLFLGEKTELVLGRDILEITKDNCADFFGKDNADKLGRMVLIRDVACRYGTIGTNIYPAWMDRYLKDKKTPETVFRPWYTWAFNNKTYSDAATLYGSVLFSYEDSMPTSTLKAGVFVVRSSGYSRFAAKPVVRDGARGDILAIFGIYSKSWTYPYGAYQLTVSHFSDIMFKAEDFLTSNEVLAMTPNGYPGNVPDPSLPNGGYDPLNDSYLTPSTADDDAEFEE